MSERLAIDKGQFAARTILKKIDLIQLVIVPHKSFSSQIVL